MVVEEALKILILENAGVSALIGTRLYPGSLPQTATYPALSYRLERRRGIQRLDPRGTGDILTLSVVRFFSSAKGNNAYSTAKAIDAALFQCLYGFNGTVTNTALSPQQSLYIDGIHDIDSRDFEFDSAEANALLLGTKQVLSDYGVWAPRPRPL